MDASESENKNIESFKEELKALMKKFEVSLLDVDDYDSEENYIGTEYYFSLPGGVIGINEIVELINS